MDTVEAAVAELLRARLAVDELTAKQLKERLTEVWEAASEAELAALIAAIEREEGGQLSLMQ